MIELMNVCKEYGKGETCVNAISNINLTINQGDFLAIMGTSGSGKTTLLNILGLMDQATSGTYRYNGIDLNTMKQREIRVFRKEHISFVFQQFSLLARYSVYENVELPLIAKGVSKFKRKEMINEMLNLVGIYDLKDKLPIRISGGQQQRCAIARAIVSGGELLLADEPTGSLDKKTGIEIMRLFQTVNQMGKTIVMVTHDEQVASNANSIIRIEDGIIV